MSPLERDPKTYAVIGAAMAVHRHLGHGFLEAVYQAALEVELARRGIEFETQRPLEIRYRGIALPCTYRADLICYGEVLVELKAVSALTPKDHAQILNYLKATGLRRGLLLNFGAESLQHKRFASDHLRQSAESADES